MMMMVYCVHTYVYSSGQSPLNLRSNCIGVGAKSTLRSAWGLRDSDELKL